MITLSSNETEPATSAQNEISANLRRHAASTRGAYAPTAQRALLSDSAVFTAWYSQAGHQAMPAAEPVARLIDAMAQPPGSPIGECSFKLRRAQAVRR